MTGSVNDMKINGFDGTYHRHRFSAMPMWPNAALRIPRVRSSCRVDGLLAVVQAHPKGWVLSH